MNRTLSVVVGTMDRPREFLRFYESMCLRTVNDWELIVADATRCACYVPLRENIVRLPDDPGMGMLRAYNRAFRTATKEFVAWFNDDVEVIAGWDEKAIAFLKSHPECGLVAVYFSDRSEDGTYGPYRAYDYPKGIPHANFGVLRRELGDNLGWFDEEFGGVAYGSDTSLCLKVVDAGYAICRVPGCRTIHHRAFDEQMKHRHDMILATDQLKFKQQWQPKIPLLRIKHSRFRYLAGPEIDP